MSITVLFEQYNIFLLSTDEWYISNNIVGCKLIEQLAISIKEGILHLIFEKTAIVYSVIDELLNVLYTGNIGTKTSQNKCYNGFFFSGVGITTKPNWWTTHVC